MPLDFSYEQVNNPDYKSREELPNMAEEVVIMAIAKDASGNSNQARTINGELFGLLAQPGPQGPTGTDGQNGVQGIQGIQGLQGDRGNDGAGINVKPSKSDCKVPGDAYINSADGKIYILESGEGATGTYIAAGEVKGPQGAKGSDASVTAANVISAISSMTPDQIKQLLSKIHEVTGVAIGLSDDGVVDAPIGFFQRSYSSSNS